MSAETDFERTDKPSTAQPAPVPSDRPGVHHDAAEFLRLGGYTRLAELMEERGEFGARKYGTPLQPFNGRHFAYDALEEGLDMLVYLWQGVMESGHLPMDLVDDFNALVVITNRILIKLEDA